MTRGKDLLTKTGRPDCFDLRRIFISFKSRSNRERGGGSRVRMKITY